MRSLHELPPFRDRWSYLYLHYGELDQTNAGLVFHNKSSTTDIPINQLSLVMLGPGTTVTHAAIKALAVNNCLLSWVGEDAIKFYAHSMGGTYSSARLIHQAKMASDENLRLDVAKRMFLKRFPGVDLSSKTIEQLRGMEGIRVREHYEKLAAEHGIPWSGRNYEQGNWDYANPANRALSAANACLYGVCHAAIVSAGYSTGLGFVHVGKMLSFVYDIADLYKSELTVPIAFRQAATNRHEIERRVRMAVRDAMYDYRLMDKLLPDIAEVLDAGDDLGKIPGELEGRAVSLADSTEAGDVRGGPEPTDSGHPLGEGGASVPEEGSGDGDATLDGQE